MNDGVPQRGTPVPAFDLKRQYGAIKEEVDEAMSRVMARGSYILGEEVEGFEEEFARYVGAQHAVGVASGTDALYLSLLALGVGPGDEVVTVPNTAVPTAVAISQTGATPVLVDVCPDTFTLDVSQLEAAITPKTKAIVPVHLYGGAADMDPLMGVARRHDLAVVEDACQAHGAEYRKSKAGGIGSAGAFSFYPTKNLGCYGDGGMIVTNDENLARKARLLRFYGMTDRDRYVHSIKGINSRLDEIQAAVLRVKLRHLDDWNETRRAVAILYGRLLPADVIPPCEPAYARHVYHLYVVKAERRDELRRHLRTNGIGTAIHYPLPIHLQPAYADLRLAEGTYPAAERCAGQILSLPMFPELTAGEVERVVEAIGRFFGEGGA